MALTQQFQAGTRPTATQLNESSIPVVTSTANISAPFAGQIIFNSSDTRLYRYTGSAWRIFTGGPSWNLTRNTAFNLGTSAYTTVAWNNELNDSGNMHAANATTVVITQAGLYAVAAKGGFAPSATGLRGCKIQLNGSDVEGSAVIINNAGGTFATAVVVPTLYIQCTVGDAVSMQQWHNVGSTITTATGSAADYPCFTGSWLHD